MMNAVFYFGKPNSNTNTHTHTHPRAFQYFNLIPTGAKETANESVRAKKCNK